ncbi:MAG: Serine--tRNA ligase [Chlamydiia bacterium]|nr:Serine--tRNA ligase [Chlamydiia bacterium]
MLDIKLIRENPAEVEKKLKTKDPDVELSSLLDLEEHVRKITHKVEELKAKRNQISKQIGELKRKGEDASSVMDQVGTIGSEIASLDSELKEGQTKVKDQLSRLPNIPDADIKESLDPKDNVCIKTHKEKREFTFTPKNHVELNEKLHLFDFARGAKMSGTGWPIYKGMGARLEWALIQYMIDTHVKNGFTQMMLPHCVRPEMMYGAGQLPKFGSQLFKINDDDYDLFLIPTSEVAINSLHYDEILKHEELPKKYVSYTPCFRREAGAAGSQERGLIRVHQFNKVEMFCFTHPSKSDEMFDYMVSSAEMILQGLDIHYRNMLLVTGDMSFPAAKTLDIEAYLPGQERYYEVSSVSNCRDFQARRSKARFRNEEKKNEYLHTLNGSGLATSRLMVALLENNQQEDGSVLIPEVLQKYLGGIKVLSIED